MTLIGHNPFKISKWNDFLIISKVMMIICLSYSFNYYIIYLGIILLFFLWTPVTIKQHLWIVKFSWFIANFFTQLNQLYYWYSIYKDKEVFIYTLYLIYIFTQFIKVVFIYIIKH